MQAVSYWLELGLRILIILILLQSPAIKPFFRWEKASTHLAGKGIPAPKMVLLFGVATIVAASVLLVVRPYVRFGALCFLAILGVGTWLFYDWPGPRYPHESFSRALNVAYGVLMMCLMAYIIKNGNDAFRNRWLSNSAGH